MVLLNNLNISGGIIMATITIKLSDQEKKFMKKMAEFEGKSLSESIREAVLNLYEDEYDAHVADASLEEYEEYLAKGGKILSWNNLLDEIDLKK
jgi:Arc/MetJ-type ribon-helix-helix transcriptional regulator